MRLLFLVLLATAASAEVVPLSDLDMLVFYSGEHSEGNTIDCVYGECDMPSVVKCVLWKPHHWGCKSMQIGKKLGPWYAEILCVRVPTWPRSLRKETCRLRLKAYEDYPYSIEDTGMQAFLWDEYED